MSWSLIQLILTEILLYDFPYGCFPSTSVKGNRSAKPFPALKTVSHKRQEGLFLSFKLPSLFDKWMLKQLIKCPPKLPGRNKVRTEKSNKNLSILNEHFKSFSYHVNKNHRAQKTILLQKRSPSTFHGLLRKDNPMPLWKRPELWHSVKLSHIINTQPISTDLIEPEINTNLTDHFSSSNYPWGSILVDNGGYDIDPKGLAYYEVE